MPQGGVLTNARERRAMANRERKAREASARNRRERVAQHGAIIDIDRVLDEVRQRWGVFNEETMGEICAHFDQCGFTVQCNGDRDGYIVLIDDRSADKISGIIIDAPNEFKVIVKPPYDVSREDDAINYCMACLDDYDIYPAMDATRITLYWCERKNCWMMATARAYNVAQLQWLGTKTYMDHFIAALSRELALAPDVAINSLNHESVYCFMMSAPDFQPLWPAEYHLMQVSGPAVKSPDGAKVIGTYAPIGAIRAEVMRANCRAAMNDYICSHGTSRNHGYIMRLRESADASDEMRPHAVYLESSLHEFVRKMYYDIPAQERRLTSVAREQYLHIRAYLTFGARNTYLMMFPHAREIYDKVDFLIEVLSDLTIAQIRASKVAAASAFDIREERVAYGERIFGESWSSVYDQARNLSREHSAHISRNGVIGEFGQHIRANIRDYYSCMQHHQLFMTLIARS